MGYDLNRLGFKGNASSQQMTSACGRYIGGGSIIFEIQGFYDSKISCHGHTKLGQGNI
uniref:Uncharacterized protein n=1 Tax=Lepeophtheirus salmonis TaxID=72036 RepID=A0A0K2VKV7_LEPSM